MMHRDQRFPKYKDIALAMVLGLPISQMYGEFVWDTDRLSSHISKIRRKYKIQIQTEWIPLPPVDDTELKIFEYSLKPEDRIELLKKLWKEIDWSHFKFPEA